MFVFLWSPEKSLAFGRMENLNLYHQYQNKREHDLWGHPEYKYMQNPNKIG